MADTDITVQTMINNSIARAKDPDKTQWSDAQMLILYNKAYAYTGHLLIRLKSDLAATEETITMIAATQEYSLATNLPDFFAMVDNGVYFSSVGTPLTPVPYEDKIRAAGDTTDEAPSCYYVTDTNIGVIDVPTATSVAAYSTLSCRYYAKPAALALTDNMPYKNIFNEPISYFADHLAVLKTTAPTEELTALYNALEESILEIVKKRVPF